MPPLWRRLLCRALGHRWFLDERGAPVTTFHVCTRCRKWQHRRF